MYHALSFQVLYVEFAKYCPEHLQEVCDLLTEKELRLRTPLEELRLLFKGATSLVALNKEETSPKDSPTRQSPILSEENKDAAQVTVK